MLSGSKSLIIKDDGTYDIIYTWNKSVLSKTSKLDLHEFTRTFFIGYEISIVEYGVIIRNLSEDSICCNSIINMFRNYDLQVYRMCSKENKLILLYAVLKRSFMENGSYLSVIRRNRFNKDTAGNINIPFKAPSPIKFSKYGERKLKCGTLYFENRLGDSYTYAIKVPYSEPIRDLMLITKKLLEERYKELTVIFSGYRESIYVTFKDQSAVEKAKMPLIKSSIEKELLSLDMAIFLIKMENSYNIWYYYFSVISMLENSSSEEFKKEYLSYLEELQNAFPDRVY